MTAEGISYVRPHLIAFVGVFAGMLSWFLVSVRPTEEPELVFMAGVVAVYCGYKMIRQRAWYWRALGVTAWIVPAMPVVFALWDALTPQHACGL
jgi:hypothetical protein